jgi:membrane associated rhomboid family serine protease
MARVNLPPLTRSLLITLIAFTLLNAIIQPEFTALGPFTRTGGGSPYLSIVPRWSWRYPWTLVTASFVEQNVFGLLISGLTLFYGGRYLERAWSSAEYAKFILIVGVVPNILCFAVYILFFEVSRSGKALYGIFIPRSSG